ncbi:site-specific recombinase XerD [Pseudomonas sp. GM84]|uniref:site-specific integrase n=1 Tax=Pseudomonas sp. GM84 TaxID=1144340 RepID=UPI00026F55D0|nr:site-specific integrase [Pseudomonas sp. GM84]EJN39676.1 site-specific recombinase XerD [Pseudomonas sp. GM84]
MRVPVFPIDLAPKSGLRRLAKALQNRWCGPKRITLSFAREVLSKALGYRNYRDLHEASKSPRPDASPLRVSDVRREIFSAIEATLKPEEWLATDLTTWRKLVTGLPVNVLTAFQSSLTVQPRKRHVSPSWFLMAALAEHGASGAFQMISNRLAAIARSVSNSGNLRDAALLLFLLSGMRPAEILSVKAGDVITSDTGGRSIEINVTKASSNSTRRVSIRYPDAIRRYIRTSRLSRDDFLFPSSHHSNAPMTADSLRRICMSWAHYAGIKHEDVLPSKIRTSVMQMEFFYLLNNRLDISDKLGWLTKHTSSNILNSYFR